MDEDIFATEEDIQAFESGQTQEAQPTLEYPGQDELPLATEEDIQAYEQGGLEEGSPEAIAARASRDSESFKNEVRDAEIAKAQAEEDKTGLVSQATYDSIDERMRKPKSLTRTATEYVLNSNPTTVIANAAVKTLGMETATDNIIGKIYDYFSGDTTEKDIRAAKQNVYEKSGEEGTWMGFPVRYQYTSVPNPDLDLSRPPGPDNPETIEKKLFVPPPDQEEIVRFGIQVAHNLAGIGDMVQNVGQSLGETVGVLEDDKKNFSIQRDGVSTQTLMPDVPARNDVESVIADVTALMIPGTAAVKGAKGAQYTRAGLAGELTLSEKILGLLSPLSRKGAVETYNATLKTTGSVQAATAAAIKYTKMATAGLALGLTEVAVSEDATEDSTLTDPSRLRFITDDPTLQKEYLMAAESAVLGPTVNVLGKVGGKMKVFASKIWGGALRYAPSFAKKMTTKEQGMRMLVYLDPNIMENGPDLFKVRGKIFSDSVIEGSVMDMSLGASKVKGGVQADTTTAFIKNADKYYRQAYAYKADEMGQEAFDQWVQEQSTETVSRMMSLRNAMYSEPEAQTFAASASKKLQDLYEQATESFSKDGDFDKNMEEFAKVMSDDFTLRSNMNKHQLEAAKANAKTSQQALEKFPETDPTFKGLRKDFETNNQLLSSSRTHIPVDTLGKKTLAAHEKLYSAKNSAYDAVKNHNVQGDIEAFDAEINKIFSKAGPDGQPIVEIPAEINPVMAKVRKTPTFGNMVTEVRNDLKKMRTDAIKKGNRAKADQYGDIIDHIEGYQANHALTTYGADAEKQAQDLLRARQANVDYVQSFGDQSNMEKLGKQAKEVYWSDQNKLSDIDGNPQGTKDFNTLFAQTIKSGNADDAMSFWETLPKVLEKTGQKSDEIRQYTILQVGEAASKFSETNVISQKKFRDSISANLPLIRKTNPELYKRLSKVDADLKTLDLNSKAAKEKLAEVNVIFQEEKEKLEKSVFKRFVYDNGIMTAPVSDPAEVIRQIFTDKKGNSANLISDILSKADKMGPNGDIIKSGLKSSYLDYIKRSVFSTERLGPASLVKKNGNTIVKEGVDIDYGGMERFLNDKTERKNMELIFKDSPGTIEEIDKINSHLTNVLQKTRRSKNALDTGVVPEENVEQATQTLIANFFGVLNPTATTARRILSPIAADTMRDRKKLKDTLLLAAVFDPQKASQLILRGSEAMLNAKERGELYKIFVKAGIIGTDRNQGVQDDIQSGEQWFNEKTGFMDVMKNMENDSRMSTPENP